MSTAVHDFTSEAQQLLRNSDHFEKLIPRPEDYPKVFRPEYVEKARHFFQKAFVSLKQRQLTIHGLNPDTTKVEVHNISTEELKDGTVIEEFDLPEDYADIYKIVKGGVRVVFVVFLSQNDSKRAGFDGFVYVDDHWAWFPKAYNVLDE